MFGKCLVCAEKDKRIDDLKREIAFYQNQINPKAVSPVVHVEANRILDGVNEQIIEIQVDEEEGDEAYLAKQRQEREFEFNSIISGNY